MVRRRRKNVLTGTTRKRKIQPGRPPIPLRTTTPQGAYGFVRPDLQLFHLDQASRAYGRSQDSAITPAMRQAATLLYNHQLRSAGVVPNVAIPGVAAPAVAPGLAPVIPGVAPIAPATAAAVRAGGLAAAAVARARGGAVIPGGPPAVEAGSRAVANLVRWGGVRRPQAFPRPLNIPNGAQPNKWGPSGSVQGNPPAGSAPPLAAQNNLRGTQYGGGAGRPSLSSRSVGGTFRAEVADLHLAAADSPGGAVRLYAPASMTTRNLRARAITVPSGGRRLGGGGANQAGGAIPVVRPKRGLRNSASNFGDPLDKSTQT